MARIHLYDKFPFLVWVGHVLNDGVGVDGGVQVHHAVQVGAEEVII